MRSQNKAALILPTTLQNQYNEVMTGDNSESKTRLMVIPYGEKDEMKEAKKVIVLRNPWKIT